MILDVVSYLDFLSYHKPGGGGEEERLTGRDEGFRGKDKPPTEPQPCQGPDSWYSSG